MAHDYDTTYYPIFLTLSDKRVVVIGAGNVAQRKIKTLVEYGGQVVVISPQVTPAVQELADKGEIELHQRPYRKGDLAGAFMVVCATDNAQVNQQVYEEAEPTGVLLNMVDYPPYCNFIVPSIVKRGPLQIAISTGGAAPVVARTIRKELEGHYDEAWGEYVELLGRIRVLIKERVPGGELARKPIFEAIAGSNLFERLEQGESVTVESLFDEFAPEEFSCKQGVCGSCATTCERQ